MLPCSLLSERGLILRLCVTVPAFMSLAIIGSRDHGCNVYQKPWEENCSHGVHLQPQARKHAASYRALFPGIEKLSSARLALHGSPQLPGVIGSCFTTCAMGLLDCSTNLIRALTWQVTLDWPFFARPTDRASLTGTTI